MKFSENFLIFIFIIINYLYLEYKIIGFYISLLTLIHLPYLKKTDDYYNSTLIKCYLVVIPAIVLNYKLNFNSSLNINLFFKYLLVVNVLVIVLTLTDNPFVKRKESKNSLILSLLICFVAYSTPNFKITNKVNMYKSNNIDVELYTFLYTVSISMVQIYNYDDWKEHIIFGLLSLWVPYYMHIYYNRGVEYRILWLCYFYLFDVYDKKNIGF